ncbi:MAG TPA: hypothetical protein VFN10_03505 [Thermoanaerobaculia bacterium]|nr:hypothetical protein [Thermoanaerobaculia bacterium]
MIAALLFAFAFPLAATSNSACRVDRASAPVVEATAKHVLTALQLRNHDLPFDRVIVNGGAPAEHALRIDIVADTPARCFVEGLCQAAPGGAMSIRCSAGGVATLIDKGAENAQPALAYVLAHEIGHLLRHDDGLFLRDVATIALTGTRAERLRVLKRGCDTDPNLAEEEAADETALVTLADVVPQPPYRQKFLNTRGSLYWNVDEILLAADRLQKREATQSLPVHPLFDPDKHPSRDDAPFFAWAAQRFACDALTATKGVVRYPLPASSHPAPEQRLRRIAEKIETVAKVVVDDKGRNDYQRRTGSEAAAELQQNVGAILSKLLEQEGRYYAALHEQVCSIVNLDAAGLDCATVKRTPPPEPGRDSSRADSPFSKEN